MNDQTPSVVNVSADNTVTGQQWKGCTLEELRRRRALSLVKREVGKERMNFTISGLRTRVADNGMRGLLFNNSTISGLRTADYVLLGFRLVNAIMKRRRKGR